jgi:hypothetical protein
VVGERLAGKVLHHEEHRAVVIANVKERADVRMIQPRDGLGFALESGAALLPRLRSGGP